MSPEPSRRAALLVLAALVVPFLVLGLVQAWHDSPTWDEGIYLAAGLNALTRHELRINLEHPPLAKVLAAAPALAAQPVIPHDQLWRDGQEFSYSGRFVAAQVASGKLRRVVFLGRLVPLAEGVAVAFALYALAAGLFGRAAGVLAGGLWLTNPFVLGLAHVMTIDVPFTLAVVLTCLALLRHVRAPTPARALGLGLAGGAALLVRSTGLLLVPTVALAAAGVALARRGARVAIVHGVLVLAVAWACVWAGVRVLAPAGAAGPSLHQLEVVIGHPPSHLPRLASVATWVPWPHEYATGIRYLALVSTPPAPAFLLGHAWDGARWWYWPGSMLVKFPLTTLAVLLAGLAGWRWVPRDGRRTALLVVALPALVLAAFTLVQPRDIGLRYLLPVIALWFVAASPLAHAVRWRSGAAVLAAVLIAQLVFLVASSPHSLAWTAPPFRPAYRVEADANLDWNQDFYRLQRWAAGKNPWVAYDGQPSISLDTIPGARQLLHADARAITGGWVAVFGSILTTYHRDELSWLRAYCPVGTLGGSILLYRFAGPPDLRPGPVVPARPCAGPFSHRA